MNRFAPQRAAARSAIVVFLLLLLAGCRGSSAQSPTDSAPSAAPASNGYYFDSDAAMADLEKQCSFGPRDPRLPAHEKCKSYILQSLKPYCDDVTTQNFSFQDNSRHVNLKLTNIFGVINPTGKPRIMISAHWDTRPTADNDFNLANRNKPIPGADDGASGVAVLIELAKALHSERPKCGIVLAFWDGEDWGPGEDRMYLGSRYFADNPGPLRPDQSILLDMVGQKDLVLEREGWSDSQYPKLVDALWSSAATAGEGAIFQQSVGDAVNDDQIPLAKGLHIPSIDVIDFNYAQWHTLQDTPDKCSRKSLEAVGKSLEQYVRDTDSQSSK